jgi:tRNA splicing endonuclease
VEEEMNQTLQFFVWKAADWRKKGVVASTEDAPKGYGEGLKAYAERQAALCQSLHDVFRLKWKGVPSIIQAATEEMERPELFYVRKQREFERRGKKVEKISSSSLMPSPPASNSTTNSSTL